jgi:hypothetical protein
MLQGLRLYPKWPAATISRSLTWPGGICKIKFLWGNVCYIDSHGG